MNTLPSYPSRRSFIEESFNENLHIEEEFDEDGSQKLLSMKDQEQMLSDLKKENFDLKLRLYMTQKNSETAEGKVSEYEQQLAALLNNLEGHQEEVERQKLELRQTRAREKELLARERRLEAKCKEQSEQIHNLSVDLSKTSLSTNDIPGALTHSTPLKNASSYFHGKNNEEDDDSDTDVRPLQTSINISHVAPMIRGKASTSGDSDSLIKRDRGVHTSVSESTAFNTTAPINKNYYSNTYEQHHNKSDGAFDNIGVVRPNNARTVVDVEFPETSKTPLTQKRKKKGGLMNVFKLCTGKSGQPITREESMYHKRPQARIVVDTTATQE